MYRLNIKTAGIVLFCAMLGTGGLGMCILPQKEYSDLENRLLQAKPQLAWEDFFDGSYQEQYETYLTDQMPGRDRWVQMAAQMQLLIGKKDINGVYIGRDGYLLEKLDTLEYEPAQVEENISFLSRFLNDAVRQYGKKRVSCILLPDKAGAMPDKLPACAAGSAAQEREAVADLQKAWMSRASSWICSRCCQSIRRNIFITGQTTTGRRSVLIMLTVNGPGRPGIRLWGWTVFKGKRFLMIFTALLITKPLSASLRTRWSCSTAPMRTGHSG